METKEIITLIGIIVSLTIGLISIYIGFKNSKKTIFINSVTKSRINWMEVVRNTISEFCSLASLIALDSGKEQNDRFYKLHQLMFQIKLQLNRNDKFDALIINQINSLYTACLKGKDDYKGLMSKIDELIILTQDLLKLEWEGIKEETKKGNLTKREKSKLYNRFLKRHIDNGQTNV